MPRTTPKTASIDKAPQALQTLQPTKSLKSDDTIWWLYLIRVSHSGSLYTGITTNVERRFEEHCAGTGAKYLRGRAPFNLVYRHPIGSRSRASQVEYYVKQLKKSQKELLVNQTVALKTLLPNHLA